MFQTMTSAIWSKRIVQDYRAGRTIALLFDYDGTLTPIVRHPSLARLSGEMRARLRYLAGLPNVYLGVISGRGLKEVRELVGLEGLFYSGCGGLEIDLIIERRQYPDLEAYGRIFDVISDHLLQILKQYPGTWLERKPAALALHFRGLPPLTASGFRLDVSAILSRLPMIRHRIVSQAIEISPASGWDKGTAVREIAKHLPDDTLLTYFGDSVNDLEAMQAVNEAEGLSIGIDPDAPQVAGHRIPSPEILDRELEWITAMIAGPAWQGAQRRADAMPSTNLPGAPVADSGDAGILVIDRDADFRNGLVGCLRQRGWKVWSAANLDEALAALHEHPDEIQISLVDLDFPGFGGSRILAELGRHSPEIQHCSMSGGIHEYAATAFRKMSGIPFFQKPIQADYIDRELRSMLRDCNKVSAVNRA